MRAGRASLMLLVLAARVPALLLQDAGSTSGGAARPPSAGMVAWIHAPKTGTSFANTLYHNKHLCPDFPADRFLRRNDRVEDFLQCSEKLPWSCVQSFCHGGVHQLFYGSHRGVGNLVDVVKDHLVGFFRQPEDRLVSAWYHGRHSWSGPPPQNITEFASRIQGCQVRTLTMEGWRRWEVCGSRHKPSVGQVQQAVRLVSNMRFVGLTEQWDFSICLFHKVMNGTCSDHDFVNMRPGSKRSDKDSTKASLGGSTDPYDTPLYEAAQRRFWDLMAENGLNREECARICSGATKTKPFAVNHEAASTFRIPDFQFDWPGRSTYDVDSDIDTDYNDE